ncbi:Hypothetical protein FKW44_003326 [Caligus rogercresseyi]|uniref:Uncharacterized protein n=1 Tax=Caligus rogercresseyi TaxID=217165 RepID=A0A7T8QX07_CALRO|nr:Hypothetical protein FKW44_003326 [Caligus rogercresseyi]
MNKMAQEYHVSSRTFGRVVKADLIMKLFKYRKMYLLNEATRVKKKARSSYCSNGTQTTQVSL